MAHPNLVERQSLQSTEDISVRPEDVINGGREAEHDVEPQSRDVERVLQSVVVNQTGPVNHEKPEEVPQSSRNSRAELGTPARGFEDSQ